jgi:hypothetical protein
VADPVVAVITGGRDRHPTIAELEDLLGRLRDPERRICGRWREGPGREQIGKVDVVRHGDYRGTDKTVAGWLEAHAGGEFEIDPWPAEVFGSWPSCGPKRNRGMLDGSRPGAGTLFDRAAPAPADLVFAFKGGVGTADCCSAALGERLVPVDWIPDVDEPRPWNRYHGDAPEPSVYVGRGSLLGNPWPLELPPGQTRAEAAAANLGRYKRWLWSKIKPGGDHRVLAALDEIGPHHHLVCSCWPRHCHAEVIVAAWRWRNRARRE